MQCNGNFKQWFNIFLIISEAWQGYESKAYGVSNHNLKLQSKKLSRTRDIPNFPTQGWADTAFYTRNWSETYKFQDHLIFFKILFCYFIHRPPPPDPLLIYVLIMFQKLQLMPIDTYIDRSEWPKLLPIGTRDGRNQVPTMKILLHFRTCWFSIAYTFQEFNVCLQMFVKLFMENSCTFLL